MVPEEHELSDLNVYDISITAHQIKTEDARKYGHDFGTDKEMLDAIVARVETIKKKISDLMCPGQEQMKPTLPNNAVSPGDQILTQPPFSPSPTTSFTQTESPLKKVTSHSHILSNRSDAQIPLGVFARFSKAQIARYSGAKRPKMSKSSLQRKSASKTKTGFAAETYSQLRQAPEAIRSASCGFICPSVMKTVAPGPNRGAAARRTGDSISGSNSSRGWEATILVVNGIALNRSEYSVFMIIHSRFFLTNRIFDHLT
jgi:hypothetical protein